MTKYRATRSFFYQPEDGGAEQLAVAGDEIKDASEGKLAALLADGLIEEARPSSKKES